MATLDIWTLQQNTRAMAKVVTDRLRAPKSSADATSKDAQTQKRQKLAKCWFFLANKNQLLNSFLFHFLLQVKIWFQNRRTKWKKQENISNAEAAELMKAKNSTKDLLNGNTVAVPNSNGFNNKLHPKNTIVGKPPLTPESLIMDKLSPGPSSSPFLRPSSATSSSNSFYQESSSNLNKSLEDSPYNQLSDRCLANDDDEDRLVIAEPAPIGVVNNNNEDEAVDDAANKPERYFGMGNGHDVPKSA